MKNKHLVFLFLAVLFLGLLSRYLPFHYRTFFRTALIQVDTAALTECVVQMPGRPELTLQRTETGWMAEQNGRTAVVGTSGMAPLLHILSGINSLRTIKTKNTDTLGFSERNPFRIRLFQNERLIEHFELGAEILENNEPATYLRLPMHEGVYLTSGNLRRIFGRGLDEFRSKTVVDMPTGTICRFGWQTPGEPVVFFTKNDSLSRWESTGGQRSLPNDSVQTWLEQFRQLNNSPFADNFDESQATEARLAVIQFQRADSTWLTLDFFYLKPPNVPEDVSALPAKRLPDLPFYVVQSSVNPLNYFAVKDTNLAHFLCFAWR